MSLFREDFSHKGKAKAAAVLWTLLIFLACFLPGRDVPKIDFPLLDKWTHFILFGVFAFLWMCAYPGYSIRRMQMVLAAGVALGWGVEFLQGQLTFLGRSQDGWDTLADAIGTLLGLGIYWWGAWKARRNEKINE